MTRRGRPQRRSKSPAQSREQVGPSAPARPAAAALWGWSGRRWVLWIAAAGLAAALLLAAWHAWRNVAERHAPGESSAAAPVIDLEALLAGPDGAGPEADRALDPAMRKLLQEAAAAVERLLKQYPDDPGPLCVLAQLHQQLGNADQAMAWWEKCLALAPGLSEAHLGIGWVYTQRGEFDKAEAALRQALAAAPDSVPAAVLLANALTSQGKFRETVALLEPRTRGASAPMPCFLLLGQAHLQLKEYDRAKPCFETAARMAPEYPNARYGLATACARLGQSEEAVRHMQRFRELESAGLGRRRDDARSFDDAATLRQAVAATYAAAAGVHAQRGADAEAQALWREAARLQPPSPPPGAESGQERR